MKRYVRFLVLILILFSGKNSFAQPIQSNIWYFGKNAGLDFNSGSPVALSGGQLSSLEGCVTMSDKNTGQLLFYSDGVTVWNRNHQAMPNGTGLWGHPSSTQTGIVIPKPDNSNQYYFFTVPAQAGYVNGISTLAYSIVDMTLDGGLGDVVAGQKNISLNSTVTEKITAILNCNGIDFWVVTHKWNSNEFYSYLVSASGISAPVISASGDSIKNVGSPINSETIGYMKFSPQGNRIAMASFAPLDKLQLFDFDGATGIVSNGISLNVPPTPVTIPPSEPYGGPYGVSFSPNGNLLYLAWHTWVGTPNFIFQYDISLGSDSAIQASRTTVAMTTAMNFGALQLGPDGKIYIANFWYSATNPNVTGYPALGRIEYPNNQGISCGWISNAVTLASNSFSVWGLPNFIESYFSPDALSLGPDLYLSPPFSVALNAGSGFSSYLWSDGSTAQTINATSQGTYWVTVTNQFGCIQTDTLHILAPLAVPVYTEGLQNFNVSYSESNSVFLSFNSVLKQNFFVKIISADGKLLFQKSYPEFEGYFHQKYSLNFSKGIYLMCVESEKDSKNLKLLVQ